jgi:hypothetical protein
MAPFNHFGAVFSTPLPPVSPPSTKRSVRERRALRGFQPEKTPNTSRDSKLRRGRRLSPRQEPAVVDSDSASTGEVSSVSDSGSAPAATERGILGDAIAGVGSVVDSAAGVISGSDSNNAPAATQRGVLGDAIAGVSSVVDSALDPITGGQSPTAVAAPEKTTAAEIESKSTDIATTASEPEAVVITSSTPPSAAVETSRPAIITTTPTKHSSKTPDAPSSSDPPVVALPGTTGVLSPEAAATPTLSKVAQLTKVTPEFTQAFPTPTAQLQSADRASLGSSQVTGTAAQKAQGQAIDSTSKSEPGSDSDSDSEDGIDSDLESSDDLDSDDEDNHTESRLVAFTTISGTPLSTLSAVLDPTAVRNLPSSVTPVSQTGGQTTIASSAANKPPLTPEASNGLIAFGAVGKDYAIQFITPANMLQAAFFYSALSYTSCFVSARPTPSPASAVAEANASLRAMPRSLSIMLAESSAQLLPQKLKPIREASRHFSTP